MIFESVSEVRFRTYRLDRDMVESVFSLELLKRGWINCLLLNELIYFTPNLYASMISSQKSFANDVFVKIMREILYLNVYSRRRWNKKFSSLNSLNELYYYSNLASSRDGVEGNVLRCVKNNFLFTPHN